MRLDVQVGGRRVAQLNDGGNCACLQFDPTG